MPDLTSILGSCHCTNIRFKLRWPADDSVILSRCCGCSFCRKHGGTWTSHREAKLAIEIRDQSGVSAYRFGTSTAEFQVCAKCGVVPVVLSDIDGNLYAVVNVNTFEDHGNFTVSSSPSDFDGEDTQSRLERRKVNWISRVLIVP